MGPQGWQWGPLVSSLQTNRCNGDITSQPTRQVFSLANFLLDAGHMVSYSEVVLVTRSNIPFANICLVWEGSRKTELCVTPDGAFFLPRRQKGTSFLFSPTLSLVLSV